MCEGRCGDVKGTIRRGISDASTLLRASRELSDVAADSLPRDMVGISPEACNQLKKLREANRVSALLRVDRTISLRLSPSRSLFDSSGHPRSFPSSLQGNAIKITVGIAVERDIKLGGKNRIDESSQYPCPFDLFQIRFLPKAPHRK